MMHEPNRSFDIVFVIPYFYPAWEYGGQPRSAFELARALSRRGHRIKVVTTDSGGSRRLNSDQIGNGRHIMVEGIDVFYCRNISNYLAYRKRIFWALGMPGNIKAAIKGADVVHIHELRSTVSVLAYFVAKRAGSPYVLSTHGGLRHLGKSAIKKVFDALWGQRMLRDASAVIAISPVEERDAISMNVQPAKLRRLPNAVRISDYTIPAKGTFTARWNISSRKVFLFLGRLHWIKGADILLRAFQQVNIVHPDTHLIIAGNDDGHESELRRLTSDLNLNHAVTFTGFLDHEAKLAAMSDSLAIVIPSRSEVFAITALEALVCRRPAILSDVCGLHPLPGIELGVVTFKSENANDLTEKLFFVLEDASINDHAARGRDFVMREFDTTVLAERAECIYLDAIKADNQPS